MSFERDVNRDALSFFAAYLPGPGAMALLSAARGWTPDDMIARADWYREQPLAYKIAVRERMGEIAAEASVDLPELGRVQPMVRATILERA